MFHRARLNYLRGIAPKYNWKSNPKHYEWMQDRMIALAGKQCGGNACCIEELACAYFDLFNVINGHGDAHDFIRAMNRIGPEPLPKETDYLNINADLA